MVVKGIPLAPLDIDPAHEQDHEPAPEERQGLRPDDPQQGLPELQQGHAGALTVRLQKAQRPSGTSVREPPL